MQEFMQELIILFEYVFIYTLPPLFTLWTALCWLNKTNTLGDFLEKNILSITNTIEKIIHSVKTFCTWCAGKKIKIILTLINILYLLLITLYFIYAK